MNDDGASDNFGTSVVMARHKIVFVGDVSVGKTSIMWRFTENVFKEHYDVYNSNIANNRSWFLLKEDKFQRPVFKITNMGLGWTREI